MLTTKYIGKVEDNRVFLICQDDKNNKLIQVPHVDLMQEQGLVAISFPNGTPKAPFRFLTTKELAMFMIGKDMNGNILVRPCEFKKRANDYLKAHPEIQKWIDEELKNKHKKEN